MKGKKKEKEFYKNINYLCKIKGGNLLLFVLFLSSIVIAVSLIGISLALQEFVDIATGESEFAISQIFIFAGGVVLVYALGIILSTIFETVYINRTERRIRLMLIQHSADTKQQFADTYHSSDILTRLTVDTERITRFLPDIFGQFAAEILPSVLALITMLILNWKMALIMLAVVPCIIIVISLLSPKQQIIAKKDIANEEMNRSYMMEVLTHLSLFRVYRMKNNIVQETGRLYEQKAKSKLHLSYLQGIISFLNSFIGFALMFVTLGVGSIFAVKGEVSVGTLIAMVQLTNYVLLPINTLSKWISKFNECKASLKRIEEVLSLPVYEADKVQSDIEKNMLLLWLRI